jgi:hypothetical protein
MDDVTAFAARLYRHFIRVALSISPKQHMVSALSRQEIVEKRRLAMKTRISKFTFFVAMIVLLTTALNAQMAIRQPLFRVDVPFAFAVGNTQLPAGHYQVYHPGDPYFVVIEKDDGKARAMVYVHPSATDPSEASAKLVFNKYGNQHFLSQVWSENDPQVHHCFMGKMEREVMAHASKPQTVVVAAKR